jgi:outer membrane protein, multidrug efflux system
MENNKINLWYRVLSTFVVIFFLSNCSLTKQPIREENKSVPESYSNSTDSINSATIKWKDYFNDQHLIALIDTALKNNQELNITLQ